MNAAEDRRRAGIFLLSALSLIVVVGGVLAGVRLMTREVHYLVQFRESVAGLEVAGPVKYNGVPVGKVAGIRFDPGDLERIQVEIAVQPGVPMKLDTRAQLKPQGITGIFYLELYGGTNDAPDLEPGDVIPSDTSFTTKIGGIANDLSELIATLNRLIKANEANITRIIVELGTSMDSIRTTLGKMDVAVDRAGEAVTEARDGLKDMRAEVKASAEALRSSLGELDAFLTDPALTGLPSKISATVDRLDEKVSGIDTAAISQRIDQVLTRFLEVEETMDRAARSVAALADRGGEDVAAMLADIRAASANVKALTRTLRDDPNRILKGRVAADRPFPAPLPPTPEDRR